MHGVKVVATAAGIGRLEDGEIAVLDSPFPHAGAVIGQTGSLSVLDACKVRERIPLNGCTLLAPLGTPNAIWGVGLNYHSKAARAGRGLPTEPILYLSASSAAPVVCGTVSIPMDQTLKMDYEGEIALVIGRRLYRAEPAEVWQAIEAITAANDLSARDVMQVTGNPTLAKSFPGFNPLGMSVSTPDELPDRDRIGVRTWLNDELLQDDTSAGMIFDVPELIARLSWFAALEPGDVVLTGTPAGTGQDHNCFLTAGDVIRVEVESALPLITTVAAPASAGPVAASAALLAGQAG